MVEPLSRVLFGDEEAHAYAVLDGASIPDLLENMHRFQPEHECLYRGDLPADLAHAAPYLVRLEPESELAEWVIGQGWGRHWGIFAISPADLREMRRHFRTFLMVHDSEGKPLYFRYYDPRVLRVYLPTCNAEELATMFGPVACYLLEAEEPNTVLRFRRQDGALVEKKEQIPAR